MTYVPGSGGGSGSISTSSDVALSNPQNNDNLVYNSGLQKWTNGTANSTGLLKISNKTSSHTLTLADANTYLRMNLATAGSLLVPTDAEVNFPVGTEIRFEQAGSGQLSIAGSSAGTIAVRDSSLYVNSSAVTDHNIVMPANVQSGDGILVHLAFATTAYPITPPADFAQVGTIIGPSGAGAAVFKKVNASSSDAGVIKTFTIGSSGTPMVGVAVALSGADTVDFIDGVTPLGPDSTNDTSTPPTYNAVSQGVLEISVAARSTGTTVGAAPAAPAGLTLLKNGATNGSVANSQIGVARGAGPVAAGTTIGTAWESGYGSTRTIGVKPSSVALRSAHGAFKTAAQYADGALTKVGPNEWIVTGYMAV